MKTIRAALVDHDDSRRIQTGARLRGIGPAIREFRNTHQFLDQLVRNQHFDVLVMTVSHYSEWLGVSGFCKAKNIPVLLCLEAFQWETLPRNGDFFGAHVIGITGVSDEELEWRIEALLYQTGFHAKRGDSEREVIWGDYRFVMDGRHVVLHRNQEIHLQPRQFELAITLFGNMGNVVSRDLLLRSFWNGSTQSSRSRALDVCVARVRTRLALRKENGFTLLPVYGRGYKLVPENDPTGASEAPLNIIDAEMAPLGEADASTQLAA